MTDYYVASLGSECQLAFSVLRAQEFPHVSEAAYFS